MNLPNNRRESRYFTGSEDELSKIKSREALQKFAKLKRSKRNISRFGSFLIFGAIISVFVLICLAVFFRIKEIELVGSERYTKEQILEISDVYEGLSLYEISNDNFKEVSQKLSYVKEIRISRKLPNTLIINVIEDIPKFYCELYGEYFVLSDNLRVLERLFDETELCESSLIKIHIPEIDSAIVGENIVFSTDVSQRYVSAYIDVILKSVLFDKITEFDFRDRFDLKLIAENLYLVELGNGDELSTKLTILAAMLDKNAFEDGIPVIIDARDPSQSYAIPSPDLKLEFDS